MAPPKQNGNNAVECVILKAMLLVLDRGGTSKEYGVVRKKVCNRDNSRSSSSSGAPMKNSAPCCACGEAKYEVLWIVNYLYL